MEYLKFSSVTTHHSEALRSNRDDTGFCSFWTNYCHTVHNNQKTYSGGKLDYSLSIYFDWPQFRFGFFLDRFCSPCRLLKMEAAAGLPLIMCSWVKTCCFNWKRFFSSSALDKNGTGHVAPTSFSFSSDFDYTILSYWTRACKALDWRMQLPIWKRLPSLPRIWGRLPRTWRRPPWGCKMQPWPSLRDRRIWNSRRVTRTGRHANGSDKFENCFGSVCEVWKGAESQM